jgi:hypothetical protein
MRGTTSIEERTRSDSVLRDRTNSSSTKTSILNDEEELEEDERAITVAKEFEDLKNKKKKYERTIIEAITKLSEIESESDVRFEAIEREREREIRSIVSEIRKKKEKEEEGRFGAKVLIRNDEESIFERSMRPFSLAILEEYESDADVSGAFTNAKRGSSFDFGRRVDHDDDDAEYERKFITVPMTVPRKAFDDRYDEDDSNEEEEQEQEFQFNSTSNKGKNLEERESWWFDVGANSSPRPVSTPERVFESFFNDDKGRVNSNSSTSTTATATATYAAATYAATSASERGRLKTITDDADDGDNYYSTPKQTSTPPTQSSPASLASPLYPEVSPGYDFERQFEDVLRALATMDLRTFQRQLNESRIDSQILDACATTIASLQSGQNTRETIWRTSLALACDILESCGAFAASEAIMDKARALASEVLKR